MRYAFLPVMLMLVFIGAACSSGPEAPPDNAAGGGDLRMPSTPTKSAWNPYLQIMSDKERMEFLAISDNTDRDQWLQRTGIDVRLELNTRLTRGISVDAARNRINEKPDEVTRDGSTTMLFYSRYNTQSRTNFYLLFEADQLVSWNAYTKEQQDRQKSLMEFEAKLMRKFNTVLERGIGMNAVRRQAENAQSDVNKVELAHRERLSKPEYKGAGKASMADYIVAEQLLNARTRNELFSWFQNRQPDRVIQHQPFENHQYFMTHKDSRGTETVVIAEFVYENGLLLSWYVYHDE